MGFELTEDGDVCEPPYRLSHCCSVRGLGATLEDAGRSKCSPDAKVPPVGREGIAAGIGRACIGSSGWLSCMETGA